MILQCVLLVFVFVENSILTFLHSSEEPEPEPVPWTTPGRLRNRTSAKGKAE